MPSEVFDYTGAVQQFVKPAGVTELVIDAYGAQGGDWTGSNPANGGRGARVQTTLTGLPFAETIYDVYIGGAGTANTAGFNGGGEDGIGGLNSACAGGGATDLRPEGGALATRLVVAGAGGGAVQARAGGNGGQNGSDGADGNGGDGGGGGSTSGGSGGDGGNDGSSGSLGTGGQGANAGSGIVPGGGGGGGYYGGGGGGSGVSGNIGGGGGGGGSSMSTGTGTTFTSGARTGHGTMTITWEDPPKVAPKAHHYRLMAA